MDDHSLKAWAVTACLLLSTTSYAVQTDNFTVLNAHDYRETVTNARTQVKHLLQALKPYRHQNTNTQVAFITRQLADIPYYAGQTGEGDWQSAAHSYQPGGIHLNQNPVYRLDVFDCQTFVQVVMGLLYSKTLAQFDQNILKIAYGAAGNPHGEVVHYYNRNNFIDGDFNPINRRNGWFTDVTSQGPLADYALSETSHLTRQQWFTFKQKYSKSNVHVLEAEQGPRMAERFATVYSQLNYPHFQSENVTMTYLPKEELALRQHDGGYQPNESLLNAIPTPAVVEIVTDVKQWRLKGRPIKDEIGSELSVSHVGFLYRQTFAHGELIYRKITCQWGSTHRSCEVKPVICEKAQCAELMFVHATKAFPTGFYFYQQPNHDYVCKAELPPANVPYTKCNRVESLPLFDYLTDYQYGSHWYMNWPTILGVHVEKLT